MFYQNFRINSQNVFLNVSSINPIVWARSCKRSDPYFYFQYGVSTSTASQLSSPASQKSKDLNKVSLLLQDLAFKAYTMPILN